MIQRRGTAFCKLAIFWLVRRLTEKFTKTTSKCRCDNKHCKEQFSPSAESRKFGFMAHSRETAETCHINRWLLTKIHDSKDKTVAFTLKIEI